MQKKSKSALAVFCKRMWNQMNHVEFSNYYIKSCSTPNPFLKTVLHASVIFGISSEKIRGIGCSHDRANHARNDLFTWQQRRSRKLRAGMERIGQLTSNEGGSGNLGCLQAYNLKWSGDSSDSCLEMSSVCQHVCSAQEFDPVLSKCVNASPVHIVSTLLVVWISI